MTPGIYQIQEQGDAQLFTTQMRICKCGNITINIKKRFSKSLTSVRCLTCTRAVNKKFNQNKSGEEIKLLAIEREAKYGVSGRGNSIWIA